MLKSSSSFWGLAKCLSNGSMYISYILVVLMAVIGTLDVILTHFWGRALTGTFELSSACLSATAFLGLPYAQRLGKHITVDIITSRFSEQGKKISFVLGLLFVLVFMSFLTWRMGMLTFESIVIMERESGPLPFPIYIFKALALFGVFAATIEALRQIMKIIRQDEKKSEAVGD